MKPSAFEYLTPSTVTEVLELLERYGDEAKIIAGGQSLVPLMNFRLARPEVLIDINRIEELDYIREDGDELAIGALVRENHLMSSSLVRKRCPILANAVSYIGHFPIRNRGTVGGSLVHADPSAEIPTIICGLDGKMTIMGPSGKRTVGPAEFFLTYLTTGLEPEEILAEVRIPVLPQKAGWSFMELSRRCGDFAIVSVASVLIIEEIGRCKEARISLGGVAPTPIRAAEAEELLSGQTITGTLIEKAGQAAAEATDPDSDYHAAAEYREDMARVFVTRSLNEAWSRYKGGR